VTYGEAFTVQPFGKSLVTETLSGKQIDAVLKQQFGNPDPRRADVVDRGNSPLPVPATDRITRLN
jgi:2',3'-cyclic-nucleotide 2'-phosphodiesterase (5'-nucleotidase family)